jgi:predicted PurR-regulated permease PerM
MFAIARSDSDRRVVSGVAAVVLAAVLISTLYVGREVFVPIALAILLSFVLAPLVRGLERWHIPRPITVIGVVLLAFASIFLIGGMIAAQVTQLAGDLPRYELTMREKIKSLRGATATSGTLERAADVLQDLGKELERPKDIIPRSQTSVPAQEAKPIPVEVRQPPRVRIGDRNGLVAHRGP